MAEATNVAGSAEPTVPSIGVFEIARLITIIRVPQAEEPEDPDPLTAYGKPSGTGLLEGGPTA